VSGLQESDEEEPAKPAAKAAAAKKEESSEEVGDCRYFLRRGFCARAMETEQMSGQESSLVLGTSAVGHRACAVAGRLCRALWDG